MAWLFGLLLLGTAIAWIIREWRLQREVNDLQAILEELAHAREPGSFPLRGSLARVGQRAQQIAREQQHLQRQRQLAEANLEIILSTMNDGVMVVDGQRTVRLVNPSLRNMFDLPASIFGQPVLEALREPEVDQMILAAFTTGQPQERELELAGRRPPVVLKIVISPMRDAAGEPGALAMFRDVTRLTQLEQVRREFVANVSHELRTPLAIFQGYVENLVDHPDASIEDRTATYAVLEKHSRRLNALVEDLLILARLEARQGQMNREPVDISAFLTEAVRDWTLRTEQKGVGLKTDIAPDLPLIDADRLRLEQVFNNLLENALKYTPSGNSITLGAAAHDGTMECWVKDTGQGILSTDLPHIFERFYRADRARSRELGGTGLGLSIVKHIVQAHGGTVEAESVFGRGTTIRMRLPIAAKKTDTELPSSPPGEN